MPAPGPLPNPRRRRRNAPTIPTTDLPAGGRQGPAPKVPKHYPLGEAGRAWWKWAWSTPQAAAWDPGDLYSLARRAQLEDQLATLAAANDIEWDLTAVLQLSTFCRQVVGAESTIKREMLELDDRFGLTAKAREQLRWKIVADEIEDDEDGQDDEVARRRAERESRRSA